VARSRISFSSTPGCAAKSKSSTYLALILIVGLFLLVWTFRTRP
jgi:hypothetical protein